MLLQLRGARQCWCRQWRVGGAHGSRRPPTRPLPADARPHLTASPPLSPGCCHCCVQMLGGDDDDIDNLNYDDLEAVAQLTKGERYRTIMAAVRQALDSAAAGGGSGAAAWAGPSEEDPTYK